ncbi:tyrosine-type recombinase/integrase [Christensenellaceae bacterium NSJ-63]|uniref:Tyrosine-type recombinase/integrase n=1 Tax=Guopingia tenuis TaxID=2763656 RepID=A0A926HWQ4_9FIRM|nr:tyrosine-type recombinase/integrase [Guopingia tenuis]MBC8537936.1 tyrosine-type recombinase/integrase [Guopingia tenuis]
MREKMREYIRFLEYEEKSRATREQYRRDIEKFLSFLGDRRLTKEVVIQYKELLQNRYQPGSVNTKLAAINGFFSFLGNSQLRVKLLKIQKKPFCSNEKRLSRAEYLRLVETAKQKGNEKLALIIQTICGTGIRVSELQFITTEAVASGEAAICLKGKNRTVLIAGRLRKALKTYICREGIVSGPVFTTRSGRPMDRFCIWKMMKSLCENAGVRAEKVFPHNLRHLFARCFYSLDKDIVRLADILGHSSINTTRIYIAAFGYEHRRRIDALGLVI